MSDFYVGYLPKAPAALGRRTRITVVVLFILAAAGAALFAISQRTVSTPATFEFGQERTFEGTLVALPYPALLVVRPAPPVDQPQFSYYSLVATGKHGADSNVANFAGNAVRLRGTLIYRDDQTMVELVPGSIAVLSRVRSILPETQDLGRFTLIGEIVDSKCNLGVMNPGQGKVHKDCAVRCLSGGIPPAFITNEFQGHPATLLLTTREGQPLPKEDFLRYVAQPVRLSGTIRKTADELFLEIEPMSITVVR